VVYGANSTDRKIFVLSTILHGTIQGTSRVFPRLNRVFINGEDVLRYPGIEYAVLTGGITDHCPLAAKFTQMQ